VVLLSYVHNKAAEGLGKIVCSALVLTPAAVAPSRSRRPSATTNYGFSEWRPTTLHRVSISTASLKGFCTMAAAFAGGFETSPETTRRRDATVMQAID
jgi:hypothetical protein